MALFLVALEMQAIYISLFCFMGRHSSQQNSVTLHICMITAVLANRISTETKA
jgi:hypothetical protein